jgi:hypothetical protein
LLYQLPKKRMQRSPQEKSDASSSIPEPRDGTPWRRVYALVLLCFIAVVAAMYLFTLFTL